MILVKTGYRARRNVPLLTLARRAWALRLQRRALAHLDDAALADVGLSRAAAAAEARRPVWDAPENWYI